MWASPNRMLVRVCGSLCIAWPALAPAQDIHKCASSAGIAYQSAPCGADEIEVAVLKTAGRGSGEARNGGSRVDTANGPDEAAQGSGSGLPFRRTSIVLGMTDDAVLNTPDWGVPARISRARQRHAWREVWIYAPRAGIARQLSFENGRLTSVETVSDAAIAWRPAAASG